jgi:hypothetical protein
VLEQGNVGKMFPLGQKEREPANIYEMKRVVITDS